MPIFLYLKTKFPHIYAFLVKLAFFTDHEEVVSVGYVVERVAEYDPDHAEQTNAVQTRDFSTVVRAKELLCVRVQRAVDYELTQCITLYFGFLFARAHHIHAGYLTFDGKYLFRFRYRFVWCFRVFPMHDSFEDVINGA